MENLKFKHLPYQSQAVEAVMDCFAGQPKLSARTYRIDPGREAREGETSSTLSLEEGFKNTECMLTPAQILNNIQNVQQKQNLPIS